MIQGFQFSYVHTSFLHADIPKAPLNVGATETSKLSESDCVITVKWDPPSIDIALYRIYIISSQGNMKDVKTSSLIISLDVTYCHDSNISIKVAAINSVGCVGPNSTEVQLSRLNISESSKFK